MNKAVPDLSGMKKMNGLSMFTIGGGFLNTGAALACITTAVAEAASEPLSDQEE